MPLLMFGTVIVPVTPLGTGLTSGDASGGSKPFGPTGAPGTVPSEEVELSAGMAGPTWANAGPQHNKGQAAARINNGLIEGSPISARGFTQRAAASTAVGKAAGTTTFFFIAADTG